LNWAWLGVMPASSKGISRCP